MSVFQFQKERYDMLKPFPIRLKTWQLKMTSTEKFKETMTNIFGDSDEDEDLELPVIDFDGSFLNLCRRGNRTSFL